MSMAIIGAVVGVGTAAYGIISSSTKEKRARREVDRLNANQPIETIPTEITKNQELASLRAKTGLPSEQYSMAQKNIQRQQAKTLRSGSNSGWASGLFGNGNKARSTTYSGGGVEKQYYDANGNPVYNA